MTDVRQQLTRAAVVALPQPRAMVAEWVTCEHAYASHMRGGARIYVRICSLCRHIDFDDLNEQAAEIERAHEAALAAAGRLLPEGANSERMGRAWYRSLTPDGKVWCESSNPDEVARRTHDRGCTFERLDTLIVTMPWRPVSINEESTEPPETARPYPQCGQEGRRCSIAGECGPPWCLPDGSYTNDRFEAVDAHRTLSWTQPADPPERSHDD